MGKTLRVIQFNMQFAQVWDDENPDTAPVRIDATLDTLREYPADLVFLQEVEQAGPLGKQPNPPGNFDAIQDCLTGMDSHFVYPPEAERELPFGVGLACFSKWALAETSDLVLPAPDIEFEFEGKVTTPTDRVLTESTIEVAGQRIRIINTHLQAFFMINATSDEYQEQRDMVLARVAASPYPVILSGDFNSAPNEGLVEQFEAAGLTAVQKREITWKRMPYVLDHVFFTRGIRLVHHEVVEVSSSDHHLLIADLEIED